MDDVPPVEVNPPKSQSSVILAGHPEPGRDVFAAAEPIDPAKSQAVWDVEAKQPPEDRVVSTVAAAAARVINIDDLVKANKPSDSFDIPISPSNEPTSTVNSDKLDRKTEDESRSGGGGGGSSEGDPAPARESEPPKEQGPVIEEVAEADRVRAELFNENPDQGVEAE